jgi:glycerophosphoryl diester phosphodiesterase
MVWGHRFFAMPGNNRESLLKCFEHKLEGVEFDIWITKDNIPIVVHGGKDGHLIEHGLDKTRVQDVTC